MQSGQVWQSKGSQSEAEPIELSGLSDSDAQLGWQSKDSQGQVATSLQLIKLDVVKSLLYLAPLLREEPVSMPLIANVLVHEVMAGMTVSSDQPHAAELRKLCLVTLLTLAARLPSIADVMQLEADNTAELPSIQKLAGHALLTHIAAAILRVHHLPQVCVMFASYALFDTTYDARCKLLACEVPSASM